MNLQARIPRFINRSNWILLLSAVAVGLLQFRLHFTLGILAGGLIAVLNYRLLARTLNSSLRSPNSDSIRSIIGKYYLRFIASGIVICLLFAGHCVDPLGLLVGLSVVAASILAATAVELTKLIFKEAV